MGKAGANGEAERERQIAAIVGRDPDKARWYGHTTIGNGTLPPDRRIGLSRNAEPYSAAHHGSYVAEIAALSRNIEWAKQDRINRQRELLEQEPPWSARAAIERHRRETAGFEPYDSPNGNGEGNGHV
jgi:hypothetical protein